MKELKSIATSVRFTPTRKKMIDKIAGKKGISLNAVLDIAIGEMYEREFPKK
jgi:hypothetical protein